ncbi:MAG TPA: GTPase [Candidatus Dojkabacteria bacterium]|jgi:GTP-binding protein
MFRDKINIKIKAGSGGAGVATFSRRTMKPNGGDGGKGGSIILEGSDHVYDLSPLNSSKTYSAENGGKGGYENMHGKDGADLIIPLPLKTKIYSQGNLILTIEKDGQKEILSEGGKGGYGNNFYKRKGQLYREKFTTGEPKEIEEFSFELELVADVIFIGLPNAGKSSILKELTRADAKVAAYEFTTLLPQLGKSKAGITLMDLPGLIEGTFMGKGLGTKFVKHTRSAKLVAHFISLEQDFKANYKSIRRELEAIDEELSKKPELIVLTKHDSADDKAIKEAEKFFKKMKKKNVVTSAYDLDSLENLESTIAQELKLINK